MTTEKNATKTPPPQTTEGKSATQPKCNCPVNPLSPCDVEKLEVKIVAKTDNMTETGTDAQGKALQPGKKKPVVYEVKTDKPRSNEAVTDVKDRKILELLSKYSYVIETIGQYPSQEEPLPKDPNQAPPEAEATVAIEYARATYHGKTCSHQLHPRLRVYVDPSTRSENKSKDLKKMGEKTLELKGLQFYAPSLPWDRSPLGTNSFLAVFEIIVALFKTTKPVEISIDADGCATRAAGEKPTGDLRTLLRIYRNETWSIGVKIPPLGSFKDERTAENLQGLKGAPPKKGDFSRSRTATGLSNTVSSSSSISRTGKTTTETEEFWLANQGNRRETTKAKLKHGRQTTTSVQTSHATNVDSDGNETYGHQETTYRSRTVPRQIEERLERSSGFEFVLARNGREVTLEQVFADRKKYKEAYAKYKNSDSPNAIEYIKKSVNDLARNITSIQDVINKIPQAGWKFTFNVSVFAGSIVLEWGPNLVEKPLANGRYHPVEYKFKGKISMELINLTLALSFGVDAQKLDSGLVLKVEGTIALKVPVEHEINMDLLKPTEKFDIKAEAKAALDVVGYVNLLGATMADARLSASTGLDFKGYLELGWRDATCALKGSLDSKAIILSGYISQRWLWDTKIGPIELVPSKPLYTIP